jgi:hypothetical protein
VIFSDLFETGTLGLCIRDVADSRHDSPAAEVIVGVHRGGALPGADHDKFDILLSADHDAPAPWVGGDVEAVLERLKAAFDSQPLAATVVAQVLRQTLQVTFDEALVLESFAYSMLLASDGFRTWRAQTAIRKRENDDGPRVRLERTADHLAVTLTRAAARNAMDARMRDELVEALEFALADPEAAAVLLAGEGAAFCAGGDLDEFGTAKDPAVAHAIRLARSPTRLIRCLGPRASARVHGACVGAGVEIPAAADRVIAKGGARFRLPEVAMGLIPGAGGVASIPRRIGHHRACYMAISGVEVDAPTALAWGLVDGVEP